MNATLIALERLTGWPICMPIRVDLHARLQELLRYECRQCGACCPRTTCASFPAPVDVGSKSRRPGGDQSCCRFSGRPVPASLSLDAARSDAFVPSRPCYVPAPGRLSLPGSGTTCPIEKDALAIVLHAPVLDPPFRTIERLDDPVKLGIDTSDKNTVLMYLQEQVRLRSTLFFPRHIVLLIPVVKRVPAGGASAHASSFHAAGCRSGVFRISG